MPRWARDETQRAPSDGAPLHRAKPGSRWSGATSFFGPMAGLNKFASAKDQLIFVRCDPCLNTVLATKLLHRSIKLPRLSAHDLGATMGEDGVPNTRAGLKNLDKAISGFSA